MLLGHVIGGLALFGGSDPGRDGRRRASQRDRRTPPARQVGGMVTEHDFTEHDLPSTTSPSTTRRSSSSTGTTTPTSGEPPAGSFRDPDGHVWEIAWNPGFTLGRDGSLVLPDFG